MRIVTFLTLFYLLISVSFAQKAVEIKSAKISGKLLRYANFPSKYVEPRNVDVWLPANYSAARKYAVIYMFDGQNLFDPAQAFGGVEWQIDETLTRLSSEGKIREAIVVAVWNTPRRIIEYSPQKAFDLVNRKKIKASAQAAPRTAYSDLYLKFAVTELKPFVDKNYSTLTNRADTFVMGSSMGGLMSLYAISEYPDVYGGAACVSTHFPLGEGVILQYMKKYLPAPKTHKIYFDYGTLGLDAQYEPFQKKADQIMKSKGYKTKNWTTRKFDGDDHNEKSWSKRAAVPLEFLLAKN